MLTEADALAAARALLDDAAELRVLERLTGGQSNQSWLLALGEARYVLRGRDRSPPPGLDDFGEEIAIWQAAHAAGLAPALVAVDHGRGLLLSAYVERVAQTPDVAALCAVLAGVHRLGLATRRIDYHAHYAFHCRAAGDGELAVDVIEQLDALATQARPGLCHHDPVPGNVLLTTEGVRLIDWEYAALGWPVFDFATLVVDWRLPLPRVAGFAGIPAGQLELACGLYRQLCAWWQASC